MSNLSVDLYFEEMGQGTPFLFVHGFPLDHATWLPVARLLKSKARCILPDTRGLGKSPVTGTEATIEDMAAGRDPSDGQTTYCKSCCHRAFHGRVHCHANGAQLPGPDLRPRTGCHPG